jgi:hypothetical protein
LNCTEICTALHCTALHCILQTAVEIQERQPGAEQAAK